MSPPVVSAEQRDALYLQITLRFSALNDLWQAVQEDDFEAADRLAREFADGLRLIVDGLGWGEAGNGPVTLAIPPEELKRMLASLRDRAAGQYESERGEQEAFRECWDRTALVRDTCDEVLRELP